MELREKIIDAIGVLVKRPETTSYGQVADAILALPEILEGQELRQRCYLHDGPGGVSVVLR